MKTPNPRAIDPLRAIEAMKFAALFADLLTQDSKKEEKSLLNRNYSSTSTSARQSTIALSFELKAATRLRQSKGIFEK